MEQLIWIKPERCTTCGYALVAHDVGDVCPECGRLVQAVGVPDPINRFSATRSQLLDSPSKIMGWMLILALFGCCVLVPVLYGFGQAVTGLSDEHWDAILFPPSD